MLYVKLYRDSTKTLKKDLKKTLNIRYTLAYITLQTYITVLSMAINS